MFLTVLYNLVSQPSFLFNVFDASMHVPTRRSLYVHGCIHERESGRERVGEREGEREWERERVWRENMI